jgi:pimeloyl-ACP methyl ester carboxylesterase
MNRASGTDGWIVSDGLRLHYVSWGRDDAPAVVMLHGLRSYAQTWADAAHALTDRYRVVALDQRGRGASDWDRGANITRRPMCAISTRWYGRSACGASCSWAIRWAAPTRSSMRAAIRSGSPAS